MTYTSRFPSIAAEVGIRIDAAIKAAADNIAAAAKERAPVRSGRLRDAIHAERVDFAEYAVVAGDNKTFYGHIVEHGGARSPSQPFLVPAFEDERDQAVNLAKAAVGSL